MKKIYFIVPVVLLAVFIFFYLSARNGINAAEEARKVQAEKDRQARVAEENRKRDEAYKMANEEALKRIAEINAKQAEDKRQAEEKQAVTDARDIAAREKESLSRQVSQYTSELQVAKDQKQKVEEQIKIQQAQITYLKTAAAEVKQTQSLFENALQKIDNANKAFELNQQAATAAAAKKP